VRILLRPPPPLTVSLSLFVFAFVFVSRVLSPLILFCLTVRGTRNSGLVRSPSLLPSPTPPHVRTPGVTLISFMWRGMTGMEPHDPAVRAEFNSRRRSAAA
jgi:hypothetical protein